MKIFVIGSSITSCYWNGAATYYRGIYRALALRGHKITFAEPDAYARQQHRDTADTSYVTSWIYQTPADLEKVVEAARSADLVIKHSGVGVDDGWLEAQVAGLHAPKRMVAFWDVDAPVTLARVEEDPDDPFRALIPHYDLIFTYGGGDPVVQHYDRLGAQNCHPIYNALDPDAHHPEVASKEFRCDLAFVGNRLPDRESRVDEFFFRAAELAPEFTFILGGEGWSGRALPGNVRYIGHVATGQHNVVNSSARMVLNINRETMANVGFSPPTRVFEAAGAGACLITDEWVGVDTFFKPGKEILVAASAEDVVRYLQRVDAHHAAAIGHAMRKRALRDHTYTLRGAEVDKILSDARHHAARLAS